MFAITIEYDNIDKQKAMNDCLRTYLIEENGTAHYSVMNSVSISKVIFKREEDALAFTLVFGI